MEQSLRTDPKPLDRFMGLKHMTGSTKDPLGLHILKRAYTDERIYPRDTIVEATSGGISISFSFLPSEFSNSASIRARQETTAPRSGGSSNSRRSSLMRLSPAESSTLSSGYKFGAHRMQGISDEFILYNCTQPITADFPSIVLRS